MRDSFEFMSEQSSRKNSAEQNPQDAVKPWAESQSSGFQASTLPGQYAHPGAANQTEASIAVTTAYPKFPFRWLYGGAHRSHGGEFMAQRADSLQTCYHDS